MYTGRLPALCGGNSQRAGDYILPAAAPYSSHERLEEFGEVCLKRPEAEHQHRTEPKPAERVHQYGVGDAGTVDVLRPPFDHFNGKVPTKYLQEIEHEFIRTSRNVKGT